MEDIIGHEKILDFFNKIIENNNLSHAYCFVGPEKIGRKTVAMQVAGKLLGVEVEKLKMHSDFCVVETLFDEKAEKTKKDISVSQIRDLRENLARSSYSGGYKIAIVDEAEKMNSEAANALLKTLEEPKNKTVLFILVRDESLLPATIYSRCQTIYFQPVKKELIMKSLLAKGLAAEEAEEMARLSFGLPGRALGWLKEKEDFTNYKQEVDRFLKILGKNFYEKIKQVEDLFGDKTDHIAAREKLVSVLNIWQVLLRDGFLAELAPELQIHQQPKKIDKNLLVELYSSLEQAKKLLQQNIHPRLLIENILLNLP